MHTLTIYTAQMGMRHRLTREGRAYVDTTVKSGDKRLAPAWDFLMEYKNSAKTPGDKVVYRRQYLSKISAMYKTTPEVLLNLLKGEELILLCYCPAGEFCHRRILREILIHIGTKYGIAVIDGGEITKESL